MAIAATHTQVTRASLPRYLWSDLVNLTPRYLTANNDVVPVHLEIAADPCQKQAVLRADAGFKRVVTAIASLDECSGPAFAGKMRLPTRKPSEAARRYGVSLVYEPEHTRLSAYARKYLEERTVDPVACDWLPKLPDAGEQPLFSLSTDAVYYIGSRLTRFADLDSSTFDSVHVEADNDAIAVTASNNHILGVQRWRGEDAFALPSEPANVAAELMRFLSESDCCRVPGKPVRFYRRESGYLAIAETSSVTWIVEWPGGGTKWPEWKRISPVETECREPWAVRDGHTRFRMDRQVLESAVQRMKRLFGRNDVCKIAIERSGDDAIRLRTVDTPVFETAIPAQFETTEPWEAFALNLEYLEIAIGMVLDDAPIELRYTKPLDPVVVSNGDLTTHYGLVMPMTLD